MSTQHQLYIGDARAMPLPSASVELVVTSPPYPMVSMWDGVFASLTPGSAEALACGQGMVAFEAMHGALDAVWAEAARVLKPGGFLVVNIGDAVRSLAGEFALYPNHARVLTSFLRLGLTPLPDILWRKPTNAPNKFMGSGMLPAGAYVTYEHEYILVARKGGKRRFSEGDRQRRARSAYFWEERNVWFSDVWDGLPGVRQSSPSAEARSAAAPAEARTRTAAFPFELPYRLIQMYSLQGDTVLDPFAGTGTTLVAAAASGRHSVGLEVAPEFAAAVDHTLRDAVRLGRTRNAHRLAYHARFVTTRLAAGKPLAHYCSAHDVPVMTSQEAALHLWEPASLSQTAPHRWEVEQESP